MKNRSHVREQRQHGAGAELSVKSAVRDSERLGDEKYAVTPPRAAVRAPEHDHKLARTTCAACSAEIDPASAYRSDAQEYAYSFCGAECYERWRKTGLQHRAP